MNRKEKIEYIKKNVKKNIVVCKNFGFSYGMTDFLNCVTFRNRGQIGKKINIYEHEQVKKYLMNNYGELIKNFEYTKPNNISEDSPIWILWWQGVEKAPEIVKKCIESIQKNSNKHSVILLDKNNYSDYIKLPEYIIDKVNNGNITITHFSDILRMSLLYEYGGIWMDATLFAVGDFTEELSKYSLFSINHGKFADFHVCKGKWAGFFLGASKNNCYIKLFRDFFYEYWKKENYLITYLLIDCIIALCYENILKVQEEIDKIPLNNTNVFEIQPLLMNVYDDVVYKKLCEKTNLFKLSWKMDFSTKNQETFLYSLIQGGKT